MDVNCGRKFYKHQFFIAICSSKNNERRTVGDARDACKSSSDKKISWARKLCRAIINSIKIVSLLLRGESISGGSFLSHRVLRHSNSVHENGETSLGEGRGENQFGTFFRALPRPRQLRTCFQGGRWSFFVRARAVDAHISGAAGGHSRKRNNLGNSLDSVLCAFQVRALSVPNCRR